MISSITMPRRKMNANCWKQRMYSGFYPELMGEFLRTLKAMEIDYYKPAVKGLRAKILKEEYK